MPDPKPPKPKILIQLDVDEQPSVFDAVVAVDSGVDHLLRHGKVRPDLVRDLVHGALFTRGGEDLKRTAIFVGGSDFHAAEAVFSKVIETFFGPFRVSPLLDSNGANTTAAAVVLAVEQSLGGPSAWSNTPVAVLGAGPVGGQVVSLLHKLGATVRVGDPRPIDPARVGATKGSGRVETFSIEPGADWHARIEDVGAIIAAGPAGVEVLPSIARDRFPRLKVAADLNAVPPHGLGGTKPTDSDKDRDGVRAWGALGVGALKMKIHKAALRALFDGEPTLFDIQEVFEVGRQLQASRS